MPVAVHPLRIGTPAFLGLLLAMLPGGAMALTSDTHAEANTGGVRAAGGTVVVTGSEEAEASVETHIDSTGTAEVRIETRRDGVIRATTTRTAVSAGGALDVSARSSAEDTSMQVRTRAEDDVRSERTIIDERSSTTVSATATSAPSHELPTVKRLVVQRIADLLRRILFFWR